MTADAGLIIGILIIVAFCVLGYCWDTRHLRTSASPPLDGSPKPKSGDYQRGYNDAIVRLVETDENAAVIAMLEARTLCCARMDSWTTFLVRWSVESPACKRANLEIQSMVGPLDAYRKWKVALPVAEAIGAQLDELERTRKAAADAAAQEAV
jgi:hypothetical protein